MSPTTLSRELDALASQVENLTPANGGAAAPKTSDTRKAIFLTGATGYLGKEVLSKLMINPDVYRIFVLVRGTPAEGRKRIVELVKAQWRHHSEKIEVWTGDLAEPGFGLTDAQKSKLRTEVDVIIHNGATIQWNVDYDALKPANVLSTLQLLQATAESQKSVSFVYVSGGQHLSPGEDDEATLLDQVKDGSGYSQTKVISELLCKRVASSKAGSKHHFTIVKTRHIIGSVATGAANTNDFLWRLFAGATEVGAYTNVDSGKYMYVADVPTVAKTVNEAWEKPAATKNGAAVVKVLDGLPCDTFWNVVAKSGYKLEPKSDADFWHLMKDNTQRSGEGHPLWPLMWMLEGARGSLGSPVAPESTPETKSATDRVSAAVESNIAYLQRTGFLKGKGGPSNGADDAERQIWRARQSNA